MLGILSGLPNSSPSPKFAIFRTIVQIGSVRDSSKQDLMSSVKDVVYLVAPGVVLIILCLASPLRWG